MKINGIEFAKADQADTDFMKEVRESGGRVFLAKVDAIGILDNFHVLLGGNDRDGAYDLLAEIIGQLQSGDYDAELTEVTGL